MIRQISIPWYLESIKREKKKFPKRYKLFGCDTETYFNKRTKQQEILSIQWKSKDAERMYFVNPTNSLDKFLDYLEENMLKKKPNFVFFHNLQYDIVALFFYNKEINFNILFTKTRFEFEYGNWEIQVIHGSGNFVIMRYNKSGQKTVVYLLDSFSFFKSSLAKLAEKLKLPFQKMKAPKGLGKIKFTKKDKYFVEYAMADTITEYYLGKYILSICEKYDVFPCVSIAQLAQRIFKKHFIKEPYLLTPKQIMDPAILSYHGGRNYCGEPGIYNDCTSVDIVSAYPYAMSLLPCFCEQGEYKMVREYDKNKVGLYCVSGKILDEKYPCIMDHKGTVIKSGKFKNIWITCFELDSCLKHGDLKIDKLFGYTFENHCGHEPALKNYVEEFFELKNNTPKEDSFYDFYKLALNSLYGKFIQTIKVSDEEGDIIETEENIFKFVEYKEFIAGGLFNPFIASLITGHTRAYLHNLLHDLEGIHASTDSVKTISRIPKGFINKNLGGLDVEVKGKLYLLRNKLYLHYDEKGKLKKNALHGFRQKPKVLKKMIDTGVNTYKIKRLTKVIESSKRGTAPLVEVREERVLHLDYPLDTLAEIVVK